jgi:hypothetical protein
MPYYLADNSGFFDTPYKTKAAARKAQAEVVAEAGAAGRRGGRRCTVRREAPTLVTINVGGKQSTNLWNRFAIVKR